MSELFREIEEDIRREQAEKLWERFGRLMVVIAVAIIIATTIFVIVKNHREAKAMEATAEFMQGVEKLDAKDYKGAIAIFDQLVNDDSSYYGPAMLRKAEAQKASGDQDAAQKTYQALAAHDTIFGAVASMMASGDSATLLEPQKDSPFYNSQREWRAWQLVKQGKKDEAVTIFLALRDNQDTPYAMRGRAQQALEHIAPDKADPMKAVLHE